MHSLYASHRTLRASQQQCFSSCPMAGLHGRRSPRCFTPPLTPSPAVRLARRHQHEPQQPSMRHGRSIACANSNSSTAQAPTPALPTLHPLDGLYESRHAFAPFANWLIPGSVMLGRYPFIEPSRCLNREQGEAQLEAILTAGITTFVCLQAEVPPQEEMKLGGKNGFMPYKSTAELIQSALNGPPPIELLDGSLRNANLNRFLPPKRHQAQYEERYKPKQLHFLHSPIVDLGLPTEGALQALVTDLAKRVEAGEKLYVHCWGGRGRAGTVGACLLAKMYGVGAEEVLERVQRAYDTRQDPQRSSSPETPAQFQFVRDYVARLPK